MENACALSDVIVIAFTESLIAGFHESKQNIFDEDLETRKKYSARQLLKAFPARRGLAQH